MQERMAEGGASMENQHRDLSNALSLPPTMMTRKFGDTAPKTANFEASEERFDVPDLQESKRMLLKLASAPLKIGLKKTRSVDEGKRALGDGRAHSDEENVGEQWPRKLRKKSSRGSHLSSHHHCHSSGSLASLASVSPFIMLMSEHSMPAGRKFSECSSHSAGSIFSRDGSIKDGAGNIQRKKSRGSKKVSERPAETPVPEETGEKPTELNSDALLSLPPQPKFILTSPRSKRRTLQRQQNVPPNLKSAKAIMTKAAEQGKGVAGSSVFARYQTDIMGRAHENQSLAAMMTRSNSLTENAPKEANPGKNQEKTLRARSKSPARLRPPAPITRKLSLTEDRPAVSDKENQDTTKDQDGLKSGSQSPRTTPHSPMATTPPAMNMFATMAMMGRSTGGDGTMTPPTPVNAPFQRLTRTRSTWSAGSKRRPNKNQTPLQSASTESEAPAGRRRGSYSLMHKLGKLLGGSKDATK